MYYARKRLKIGTEYRQPGEPVPEAYGWRNLDALLSCRHLVEGPDLPPEPPKPAPVPTPPEPVSEPETADTEPEDGESFGCPECEFVGKSQRSLSAHMRRHA